MSREARLRQLLFINSIDRDRIRGMFFVTLTQRGGAGVVESWERIEAARRKWFKRLERFLGNREWFAMWRKEPHQSGEAHLHVLIFFLGQVPHLAKEFRPWNDRAWAESVGDLSIERTACNTQWLQTWNGVACYLAKYLSKEQDLQGIETGKVWDVVNRASVPRAIKREIIADAAEKVLRRICRKWRQRQAEFWERQAVDDVTGALAWRRLFPWRQGSRRVTVAMQLETLRGQGVKVRRRRPKIGFTEEINVWGEVTESRGGRRDVVTLEKLGTEKHTHFSGLYFFPSALCSRLVEWAKAMAVDKLLPD